MTKHDQWIWVAALQPVLLLVCVLVAPSGGWAFGLFTGGGFVHALHMAYPDFAKEPTDD